MNHRVPQAVSPLAGTAVALSFPARMVGWNGE